MLAAASITSSQLSRTSRSCFAPSAAATRSGVTAPAASSSPSVVATVTGTRSGSDSSPSSATHTPSANLGSMWRATSRPSRVLPMPPAPTRVTSRCAVTRAVASESSASRPISPDVGDGRFVRFAVSGRDDNAAPRSESASCSLVAAAGDGLDEAAIFSQNLAQRRDVELKAVLLDHHPRPYTAEDFVLANELPARLDQYHEDIE